MDDTTQAASPASIGDENKSDNISLGQAAAILFAKQQKAETKPEPAPAEDAAPVTETPTEETTNPAETAEPTAESSESEAAKQEETPVEEETEEKEVLSKKSSDKETRIREKVQKRVDEEVAKRKALEERIASLESVLKKAEAEKANPPPAPAPMPKSTLPLAEYNDLQSLQTYRQQAKEAARWAKDQLLRDDIADGVQLGDQVLTKAQITEVLRKSEIALEDHIPAREQFLLAKSEASKTATQLFPFLNDPKSEDYQVAVQAYRLNPWLQDLPNADFIVGVQVEGLKALKAKQEAAAKPKEVAKEVPKEKPKPKPIIANRPAGDQAAVSSNTTSVRAPSTSNAKNALEVQREKLRTKGAVSASEAAALLLRSEQLKNLR